jgi:hypothetical protein
LFTRLRRQEDGTVLRAVAIGLGIALVVFGLTAGHVIFLPLLYHPVRFPSSTARTAAAAAGDSRARDDQKRNPVIGLAGIPVPF